MTPPTATTTDTTSAPELDERDDLDGGAEAALDSVMKVRKRNGDLEPVDLNKIVRAIERCAHGLDGVDAMRIATTTISGLHDGTATSELDALAIRTAAGLTAEEPNYSRLAARILSTVIDKEVAASNIYSFSQSVHLGYECGIIAADVHEFVNTHARKLNDALRPERDWLYEFFGLRTVYDRYLLRHPETRQIIETPQHFLLRVACGLAHNPDEAIELYEHMSVLEYLPGSPTLFNSGTSHPQMSSCYLLDSPQDDLAAIYSKYGDIAQLSKFAGGIGLSYSRIRSRDSLIRGTNGLSNGIVPWLKTLDSSVAAVNQGGRRKGAACVYLETWHADVEEFLELKDNTGDLARRTHNLNLANWIPDEFMRRVEADAEWSLFDPKKVPHLVDAFGDDFTAAYIAAEEDGLAERSIPARQLYGKMMRTLAETGNGWMTFKDPCNVKNNQTSAPGAVVHSSNLCVEITEVTSADETAVCNLGSLNLAKFTTCDDAGDVAVDYERLGEVTRTAVKFLDRVIDINFYPVDQAGASNSKWRPVGLGLMGLQDVFFQMGVPFDSQTARTESRRISEHIYFHALWQSTLLAEEHGPHETFGSTRAARGDLQFDLWGVSPSDDYDWPALRARIEEHGLRNSLLIAIAPTATIASISGAYECIEPQVSNLFKRETLSGEFLQINKYLVRDLQARGLWTPEVRAAIKAGEGSVQHIEEIPADLREIYRTAWEIPMKSLIEMAADRGAFIDQSQSLNLFVESPNIGKLSSMYMYAWKQGLKTTYYLRSRPATRINKTSVTPGDVRKSYEMDGEKTSVDAGAADPEAVACSLENPESCESCQ